MATLIGNTGSAVTATVETLTSTNTGASVAVNSGVKVIRVPSGVTVSGGNSVGTSGLTVNGNGKAIVLQEGGNIVGGPGTTSNNYGGSGGTGATALTSNTTVKYIKSSGSIIGGGGGGGGPGKGRIMRSYNAFPTWNAWPGINTNPVDAGLSNSNYYVFWGISHSYAEPGAYGSRNYILDVANSLKKSSINFNSSINGSDGNSGSVPGPGLAGDNGNDGSNNVSVNGVAVKDATWANWPVTNISPNSGTEYHVTFPNTGVGANYKINFNVDGNRRVYMDYNYRYGVKLNSSSITAAIIFNWVAYNSSNYSGSYWNKSNSAWAVLIQNTSAASNLVEMDINSGTKNNIISATAGGSGGQPGNAYNTTNTTQYF